MKLQEQKMPEIDQNQGAEMQVDIDGYIKSHPDLNKDKKNIFGSPIFSPKKGGKNNNQKNKNKDGFSLEKFTWWNITRAKNHDKSIDAEAAHDAVSGDDNRHEEMRKTKSFTVLPRSKRSALYSD